MTVLDSEQVVKMTCRYLCKGCKYSGKKLRSEGLVDCELAGEAVAPLLRSQYPRYEFCPQRMAKDKADRLLSHQLKLLAVFARRLRLRGFGINYGRRRLKSAEAVLKENLRISQSCD